MAHLYMSIDINIIFIFSYTLRRDGIDVLYKPEAEIHELYDLIPTDIGDYNFITFFMLN